MIAYIGIGSNLGDRKDNIVRAVSLLRKDTKVRVLEKSKIYETLPLGPVPQPDYLNGVLKLDTEYKPGKLLEKLKETERFLGRKKTKIKWAPREIDLDILFYGNRIIREKGLFIPHREVAKRWFVLKPMSDIAPGFMHPVLKRTIKFILREYENSQKHRPDAESGEGNKKRR